MPPKYQDMICTPPEEDIHFGRALILILSAKPIDHMDHWILKCLQQVTSSSINSSLNGLLGNGCSNQVSLGLMKANWFQWQEDFQKNKCLGEIILNTGRTWLPFFLFSFCLGKGAQMVPLLSTVPVKLWKMNTGNETCPTRNNWSGFMRSWAVM